jgi:2-oxo-3-(phosphooxy)propyl 3-oxoalkanoate synthase
MLIAETIRQVGALLAHAKFDVPLGHHFLMWDLSYTAVPGALDAGPTPTELTLRVSCHDLTMRGKQLSSLRYRAEVWHDATRIAVGSAGYNCTSPAVYRRIRGERPLTLSGPLPPPLDPAAVGRKDVRDVVLSDPAEAELADQAAGRSCQVTDLATRAAIRCGATANGVRRRWLLRVDTTHPVFFDHPVDHVPGMMLIEAARQAAQALLGPEPVQPFAVESTFERYAELNVPCWIEAELAGTDAAGNPMVSVTGQQNGEPLFSATVATHPLG